MTTVQDEADLRLHMKVIQTDVGLQFSFTTQWTKTRLTAERLHAPECCDGETITVIRDGKEIDTATIRWYPGMSSTPSFEDFRTLGRYMRYLRADALQLGDEVIIAPTKRKKPKTKVSPWFANNYWVAMTATWIEGKKIPFYLPDENA